eukprot:6289962-Alexandrium_andersonii.AAC.1
MGGSDPPNVRSRYAAKDIAFYKDDSLFAATPHLESSRHSIRATHCSRPFHVEASALRSCDPSVSP